MESHALMMGWRRDQQLSYWAEWGQ